MNSAGTMTYDPAYIDDWRSAAGCHGVLSRAEVDGAMLTFLQGYASRGYRPAFIDQIARLKSDVSAKAYL